MKFIVYILQSGFDNSYYIGLTVNLKERLLEHNHGTKGYTRKKRPWRIIHFEEYQTKTEALIREKYLKKLKNKKYIQKLVSAGP